MNSQHRYRALWGLAAGVALAFFASTPLAAQQGGTIEGSVTDAQGRAVGGAQVSIVDSQRGTITAQDGTYRITGVPAGARQVRVQRIGYRTETLPVNVAAGETVALNVTVTQSVLDVDEVIVTGVAGETSRAKLPITVDHLSAEQLPVPAVSAGSMIQGKVAGAQVVSGSGRPGSAPTILLRGPTSINASGRNQEPLYIVDGVILSSSMVDIDALDIESVEVVKGAAAASLYGSRAASGVVQITTRRGRNVADDQVRYTARTEIGQSQLPGRFNLTQRHQFAMTPDGSQFLDAQGNPCHWLECGSVGLAGQMAPAGGSANAWNTIHRETWPGTTYDQVAEFFTGGQFQQHYLSAEGRSGATNYHLSFSNLHDQGVMPGHDGFTRNNFRLNLDQSVRENLQLSGSAFYSRSDQNAFPESQGNPIFRLTRMPAGVNLRACVDDVTADCSAPGDRLARMIIEPDPFNENDNPLYELLNREYVSERGRFLGSANMRYTPIDWFTLDGNVSYDRLDYSEENIYPQGYRDIRNTASQRLGSLYREHSLTEGLNASVTGTFRAQLADWVNNRTQVRYLWEQEDFEWTSASGFDYAVGGIHRFNNINQDNVTATSGFQPVRSDGFFVITTFDILDRYIIDGLIRNDGSSLFGPDERRHWYGRVAGAWRLTEEPWWQIPAFNELKLRYSLGTAGGRPNWSAQYETYSVSAGAVSPVTLGNRNLKPEFSVEQEAGVEAVFLDRFGVTVNYATTRTEDQILQVPLQPYLGFGTQWQNAGTLASNTWEAAFDAQIIQTPDFTWSTRLLFDRTRQEITQLNVPAYTTGVTGQNMGSVFYVREGEVLGTFYGTQIATSCDHLPAGMSCDGFAVNDDGFLVWVGDAGSPNQGWNASGGGHHWGTTGPSIAGVPVQWGTPIVGRCTDRVTGEQTTYCPLGNTTPDYSVSLSNTLNWRGLSVYGLLDAVQGFQVYNQPLQWAVFQSYAGIMDQSDRPESDQKPLGYYNALYSVSGLAPSSRFVEDASFLKLRELAVRYRFGQDALAPIPGIRAFDGVTLSAIGRNLFTWSDYDGYDPEVGRGGGGTGSAALARVDGFNYPNFRTFTFGLELNF
jgi:TonB-linked SusC/RagA family outer membrane protein